MKKAYLDHREIFIAEKPLLSDMYAEVELPHVDGVDHRMLVTSRVRSANSELGGALYYLSNIPCMCTSKIILSFPNFIMLNLF